MKRKDELKIEILSNIKDEIIDKQSAKRYELMNKRRIPKWILPSSVAAVILLTIMIPVLILLLVKQVPVYEGMTVSKYKTNTVENTVPKQDMYRFDFLSIANGNNGNHNGHNKKPIDEIIEEDSSIGIEIPEQQTYYADPSEDIYITVHISNPDSFEILSFTLNGKKYSSYMFEDGSDMENLILKVNVGNEPGIVDFTIDAIKYVDGTEIKDVIMRGDKTIKVGIYSADIQPAVSIDNEIIGINDISFKATLTDEYKLIERSGGKIFAGIFTDDGMVAYKELFLGENEVFFDGLETYTSYRYGVAAYYDALDGNGMAANVLSQNEFTTQSAVALYGLQIDQTSIDFGLEFSEIFESKKLSSMALYHGEDKVKDFDVSGNIEEQTFKATGLLSNNEYRLVIAYENLGAVETVEFKLNTLAKATPDFTLTETEKTQTSFKFDVTVTDVDNVGAITKIELIHGDEAIAAENTDVREFTNLLSNNDYTVKVTYTYDLGDGVGNQTLVKELTVKTEAKATPHFTVTETEKTQTSFKFDIAVTDIDGVGEITKLEFIHGEDAQNITDLETREFTALLSDNDYTVRATYTYDLNDGVGDQTLVKELTVETEEKVEPAFTIKGVTADLYTINGEYDQTNVDNTLISYTVSLYKGDELVKENADKKITFDSLDYYTDYTIRITYTFDVNDGKGVQTKTAEQVIKTQPYVDVESIISRNATAVFDGDTIYIQANIINPCGVKVTHVNVNENKYEVLSSSTATQLFIEIVCDETLGGGNVEFKIDRIYADLEGASYEIAVDSEASATVFINGPFEILNIEFVNEQYEQIYWRVPDEKYYVKFTVNNPTGYEITKIEVGSSSEIDLSHLIKINDSEYVIDAEYSHTAELANDEITIHYKNQYVSNISDTVKFTQKLLTLTSNEIKYISTAEEFIQAITEIDYDNRVYYKLSSDIDLAGKSWDSVDFYGVIDGNGYAIKNYAVTGDWNYDWFGMFYNLYGGIINVDFENTFIMLKRNDVDMMGGLPAFENHGLIQNCTIDSESIINMTGNCDFSFGGFVGRNSGTIENCTNNANVSTGIRYGAFAYDNDGTVKNCVNNGDITCWEAHGIANGGTIQDCVNNGNIEGVRAYGISERGTLTNCINNGDVLAKAEDPIDNDNLEAYGITKKGTQINCVNNGTVSIQYLVDEDEDGEWETKTEIVTE